MQQECSLSGLGIAFYSYPQLMGLRAKNKSNSIGYTIRRFLNKPS